MFKLQTFFRECWPRQDLSYLFQKHSKANSRVGEMSTIFQNRTVVMEAREKNAKTFKSWWITGSNENGDSLPVPQIDDDEGEIWASQHVGSGHIL